MARHLRRTPTPVLGHKAHRSRALEQRGPQLLHVLAQRDDLSPRHPALILQRAIQPPSVLKANSVDAPEFDQVGPRAALGTRAVAKPQIGERCIARVDAAILGCVRFHLTRNARVDLGSLLLRHDPGLIDLFDGRCALDDGLSLT
eukprot:1603135-Prymnesium_polylepis.1